LSRFHVLISQTYFGRYRGRRVPLSCFALTNSFWEIPLASGPVFKFCAPGLILGGTDGRRVQFSCFALPDSFLTEPRASGPVCMFCAPGPILVGTDDVGSRFHVCFSLTRIGRYRGRRVQFSCFVLPDSFWVVLRASSPTAMFCIPGLVFIGIEGAMSRFHILRF
jgi:hypothetical protein